MKSFPSFPTNAQRKVFHAFSFQLCSTANSKLSFNVSLCEINCIKLQTISLVSKSIYSGRDSLCFIYFDFDVTFKLVELVFSHANEIKTSSCATTNTGHAQSSYLTVARLSIA